MDFGTKCQKLFMQLDENHDILKAEFLSCYKEMVVYLQYRLSHDSYVVKDLQYFHPKKIKMSFKSQIGDYLNITTMALIVVIFKCGVV